MRRVLAVSILVGLLSFPGLPGRAGTRADAQATPPTTTADAIDPAVERALALALARPSDGPFVARLVREARASSGGLPALRSRLETLAADPSHAFAARCVAGHVARAIRDVPGARAAYDAAAALRPGDAIPRLGLGRIARDTGELALATTELAAAYERMPEGDERRAVATELGRVALAARDFEATDRWFGVATRGRPRYERAEIARAYADVGEHERAIAVLRTLADESRGDAREEAPALRDLGLALVAGRRFEDAIATLERAKRLARGDSGLVLELDDAIVEAHRRGGRLDAYVDALIATQPRDAATIATIAALAEELGRDDQALEAYRRVVALAPRDPEPRARVVRLLLRGGRVDEALVVERALVESSPRASRYFVPAIERLVGFGRVDEALALFDRVAAGLGDDLPAHVALADLAERLGDEGRLLDQLEVLVRLEPDEPSHRIALATERLSRGERDDALAMLDAALREASSDPEDLATVAMALADRGFPRPAEEALRAELARQPESLALLRAYADVLDPNGDRPGRRADVGRTREAIAIYERVLRSPAAGTTERRDARRRILALERRLGRLDERAREWERILAAGGDPAADAGHFLLELRQSERPFDAVGVERVATRLVAIFPRDVEAYLALERARTVVGDHVAAIAALERLVDLDPARVDAYVDRLVSHAEAAYLDDDALRFARLGVERSPTDPRAEARLGDLLRRRRDPVAALAAYQRALAIDDRRTDVWLSVAGLAIAQGDVPAAVNAYDRVLRLATDDDSVGRASEEAANALAALHRDDAVVDLLLPHVATRPRVVSLHRALFVALDRRVRELERSGDRDALADLGRRGLPVLLESLADRDGERAARAARLLGHLGVASAFDTLIGAAARHPAEVARRSALESAARLATPARAPEFRRLLDAPERRTRLAAALVLVSLGTSPDDRRGFLAHGDPWVRGAGWLAAELADEDVDPALVARAMVEERDVAVRALATLAAHRHENRFLGSLVEQASRDELVGRGARLALARIDTAEARLALARVITEAGERVPDDAIRAALGRTSPEPAAASFATAGDLGAAVRMLFAALDSEPSPIEPALLADVAGELEGDAPAIAFDVFTRLDAQAPPGPWVGATRIGARIRSAIAGSDESVRLRAIRLFPRVFGAADVALLDAALRDRSTGLVRAALEVVTDELAMPLGPALADLAMHHTDFDVRCAAASLTVHARANDVVPALERVLRTDPVAFVREAAARSLATVSPGSPGLAEAREDDPEPRVRDAARIPSPTAIRVVDAVSRSRLPMRSRSGPLGDRSSDG